MVGGGEVRGARCEGQLVGDRSEVGDENCGCNVVSPKSHWGRLGTASSSARLSTNQIHEARLVLLVIITVMRRV